jgi:hypothetical protein
MGYLFLPQSEVGDGYAQLMSIAPNIEHITHFSDYVLNYYVSKDADFNSFIWAAEPSDSPRTTNGPKSFHSYYYSQSYTPHPNIFQVIDVLEDFQVQTMLKTTSILNNKINVQRNDTLKKHKILHAQWAQYKNDEISQLTYLMIIGQMFQAAPI